MYTRTPSHMLGLHACLWATVRNTCGRHKDNMQTLYVKLGLNHPTMNVVPLHFTADKYCSNSQRDRKTESYQDCKPSQGLIYSLNGQSIWLDFGGHHRHLSHAQGSQAHLCFACCVCHPWLPLCLKLTFPHCPACRRRTHFSGLAKAARMSGSRKMEA